MSPASQPSRSGHRTGTTPAPPAPRGHLDDAAARTPSPHHHLTERSRRGWRRSRHAEDHALGPTRRRRRTTPLPLVAWTWRHLIAAACVCACVLCVLSVLRPDHARGHEVIVLTHEMPAGAEITSQDIETRRLPADAVPTSAVADETILGHHLAVALPAGTILTTALTTSGAAATLSPGQRLVEVPVDVGAGLAQPGLMVDLIATADPLSTSASPPSPGADGAHAPALGTDPAEDAPAASPSPSPADTPHAALADTSAMTEVPAFSHSTIICDNARIVSINRPSTADAWSSPIGTGTMVTLVVLAVPEASAPIIVAAATRGSLGLVVSP